MKLWEALAPLDLEVRDGTYKLLITGLIILRIVGGYLFDDILENYK